LSKAFYRFPSVGMRNNTFRQEAIADHEVEEY